MLCLALLLWQAKGKRRAVRVKSREARRNSGQAPTDEMVSGGKRGLFGVRKGLRKWSLSRARAEAGARQQSGGHAAAIFSYVPPAWLSDHIFRLPADAEVQHAAAMKAPQLNDHAVRWSLLREAQAEDEARLQAGHKKRMPWLTTAKHINRTSYSQLSVDVAMAVLSLNTADQLRLRRHGYWVAG